MEGLLRSLLYSIVQQYPTILNSFPAVQELRKVPVTAKFSGWSLQELKDAFSWFRISELSTKFCFFIDGLDEYDGVHEDVIDIIMTLAVSPNIKFCLSSRPWNVFEDAFGGDVCPKIRLQDLTRKDIESFIKGSFACNRHFVRLRLKDKRYEGLVQEIVTKAQGVFLWVHLVVRSLLRGLTDSDTMSDLERRLALVPPDLETFFGHMLDSIEPVYRQQAARILQLCLASRTPPYLITLSYYDEHDPDYGLKSQAAIWSDEYFEDLCEETWKRVNARCADLVELATVARGHRTPLYPVVTFLHRTVMDHLQTQEVQTTLSKWQDTNFEVNRHLCQAYLAHLKHVPFKFDSVEDFFYSAACMESKLKVSSNAVIEEFHQFCMQRKVDCYILDRPNTFEFDFEHASGEYQHFLLLAVCVRFGLAVYINTQLNKLAQRHGPTYIIRWLLAILLKRCWWICAHNEIAFESGSMILRDLLDYGPDPNYIIGGTPILSRFLQSVELDHNKRNLDIQRLGKCLRLLLLKGTSSKTHHVALGAIGQCPPEDKPCLYALCSDKIAVDWRHYNCG